MKDKLVLWGKDKEDKKLLLALELVASENEVKIHKFPATQVTEEYYQLLMNEWKRGNEVPFDDAVETISRPLSVTEDILPEDIRVDRTDLVNRAKTEWHFIVLSSKLHNLYKSEVQDLKEKVNRAEEFTEGLWEEAKGFWSKVQDQIRERNLFRDHANDIKRTTNEVFDDLKSMRKEMESKLKSVSKESFENINNKIQNINTRLEEGKTLKPLFDELKKIQRDFKDSNFTRDDHNKLWKYLDGTFKKIKEKMYGDRQSGGSTALGRLENRYKGLLKAIDRMNSSIGRDKRDIQRENAGISNSGGQLEAQLRQAKLQMIEQRIKSKQLKLDDMLKTKENLEAKLEKERVKEQQRKEQEEIQKAKQKKKEEIAERIVEESHEVIEENKDELKSAVKTIKEESPKKEKKTPPTVVKDKEEKTPTKEKETPPPVVVDKKEQSSIKEKENPPSVVEDQEEEE